MAKDLIVTGWEDRPGVNAKMGEALGKAEINIEGTFGSRKLGEIHVLVDDSAAARKALEEAGFEVAERDVLVLADVENRPGAWGEVARRIADHDVNIDFHYVASNDRLVVGVDDLEEARAALTR